MSLLDVLTGGENSKAQGDLANVLAQIQGIQTPTAQQLQLSPLSQYNIAQNLNPALVSAALEGPSAFNNENNSAAPMEAMQQALGEEQQIASSNGMTPQERSAIAQAEEQVNENTAGQRGAIEQNYARMGVPQSLIAAALENGTVGQNAEQAYQNALQAQSGAANNALTAMQNSGALAGTMNEQQLNQANTVAAAQNALNQFNTANTQQANLANQANTQASNAYNATNAQNVANQNVTGANERQYQNQVEAPQQAAGLALQKGNELAGAGEAQANQATQAGQQQAGLVGGLVGAGATGANAYMQSNALNNLAGAVAASEGGEIPPKGNMFPATNFKSGGPVPGRPMVQGNSPRNDTVPAMLSPGEVVLPRTVVQNPRTLGNFLVQKAPQMASRVHPSDLASIIRALSELRNGATA